MKLTWWHNWLSMPYRPHWKFKKYLAEETKELARANGFWHRTSEKADILYSYSRGIWNGYNDLVCPISKKDQLIATPYMLLKISGRWLFFRRAGHKLSKSVHISVTRNPKKIRKLKRIAKQWNLKEEEFVEVCHKQLRYWILLP